MKHKTLLLTLAAAFAFGLVGCNKNEPTTTATDDANKAASSDAAAQATNAATEVTNAAVQATNAAATMNAADNGKVQELIDTAKGLVADGKFSDASSLLQQLAGQSLTDVQQKLVDDLKDQIQKALAAKAAGAAGNLLKQ